MAQEETKVTTVVHDVHGVTHDHPGRVVGARLFPGAFQHTGGITNCLVRDGTTGQHEDFGNAFSETFRAGIGPGFRCVNVQLSGWNLDFESADHHIDTIQVRISNVAYNATTGEVSFKVTGSYRDKNGDDNFRWEVWYSILALG